jgi:hypothetical protein
VVLVFSGLLAGGYFKKPPPFIIRGVLLHGAKYYISNIHGDHKGAYCGLISSASGLEV